MCPSLIEIGSKTAEKNSAQTNRHRQTKRHYENNGHLAVNQNKKLDASSSHDVTCAMKSKKLELLKVVTH